MKCLSVSHLKEVLREEKVRDKNGDVPKEAALPDFEAKSLKQLGQPTADSLALAKKALCSPEQLQAAIARECERRQAAGFADAVQAVQPRQPQLRDKALAGKRFEICWHYTSTEDGKTKERSAPHRRGAAAMPRRRTAAPSPRHTVPAFTCTVLINQSSRMAGPYLVPVHSCACR